MIRVKVLACLLLGTVCALPGFALDDEMHGHHHDPNEQLGKVSFPISCEPGSQAAFERGVALLHSFGYEEAGSSSARSRKRIRRTRWRIGGSR